jgi:hypothetical protein
MFGDMQNHEGQRTLSDIEAASARLDAWIQREGYKGYEPHDALNSPFLHWLGSKNRLLGIALLQAFRRSPVNLRSVAGIRKDYNPKGMGLFLASYVRKYQLYGDESYLKVIYSLADWLKANVAKGYSGCCWGYNFDWPNRAFYVEKGVPTIVNTTYIASAFLDEFDCFHDEECLAIGRSACDFILSDLNILEKARTLCFSYTPLDERYVYNASLLGAVLLARVYSYTQESLLLESAEKAARFVAHRQSCDGGWTYGESVRDGWVDNFHTGFVLSSLADFMEYSGTDEFMPNLEKGYRFYKESFFLADGTPKYYPHRVYPIDVHSVAQAIITLLRLREIDPEAQSLAYRVASWGIENMQDERGFFHYQIHRLYRIKIPYIRWGQAWMQKALTELLLSSGEGIEYDTAHKHSWVSC